jgi:hypothetical protein
MKIRYVTPAWTGPGSPQSPVPVSSLPLPRYQPRPVASCPDCMGDCTDEGTGGFWCPGCHRSYTAAQVGYFDEGNLADD